MLLLLSESNQHLLVDGDRDYKCIRDMITKHDFITKIKPVITCMFI